MQMLTRSAEAVRAHCRGGVTALVFQLCLEREASLKGDKEEQVLQEKDR